MAVTLLLWELCMTQALGYGHQTHDTMSNDLKHTTDMFKSINFRCSTLEADLKTLTKEKHYVIEKLWTQKHSTEPGILWHKSDGAFTISHVPLAPSTLYLEFAVSATVCLTAALNAWAASCSSAGDGCFCKCYSDCYNNWDLNPIPRTLT